VVQLERLREQQPNKIDRLRAEHQTYSILGVDVPEVLLFVAPGRNLAILVEAATRAYILRVRGIDPLNEFMRKQQAIISNSPST
jgi:HPr kinase/phosphorylase